METQPGRNEIIHGIVTARENANELFQAATTMGHTREMMFCTAIGVLAWIVRKIKEGDHVGVAEILPGASIRLERVPFIEHAIE